MVQIASYIELMIQAVFSEAFAFSFLLGAVLFLVGIGFCLLFIVSRLSGKRIPGTVVGAVLQRRVKTKTVDGKETQKIKETLYPVFEYQKSDGSLHRERASEGGSSTLKYQTGQAVNLIVREDDGYDDVYDAGAFGALYLGLAFSIIGLAIMIQVGSMASALGIGIFSLIVVIAIRVTNAVLNKKSPTDSTVQQKYSKAFDPNELKPIEYFQKQSASS